MRSITIRMLSIGMLVVSAACGVKTKTTDVNPAPARQPTCEAAIEIYEGRSDVPSSYSELAWIEASGNSVWTTDNQMRDEMKKRAAEVGANGLIANPVQQNKAGVSVIGEAIGARTATARATGLAIWMPDGAARTRLACGR